MSYLWFHCECSHSVFKSIQLSTSPRYSHPFNFFPYDLFILMTSLYLLLFPINPPSLFKIAILQPQPFFLILFFIPDLTTPWPFWEDSTVWSGFKMTAVFTFLQNISRYRFRVQLPPTCFFWCLWLHLHKQKAATMTKQKQTLQFWQKCYLAKSFWAALPCYLP